VERGERNIALENIVKITVNFENFSTTYRDAMRLELECIASATDFFTSLESVDEVANPPPA